MLDEKRAMVRSTALMYGSEILSKLFQLGFIIILTRAAGAANFGKISFALAVGWIIYSVSDLGINNILIRDLSVKGARVKELVSQALAFKVRWGLIVSAASVAALFLLGVPTDTMIVASLIFPSLVIDSFTYALRFGFVAQKHFRDEAILKIIFGGSKFALILAFLIFTDSPLVLASTYLASSGLTAAVAYILFKRHVAAVSLKVTAGIRSFVSDSIAYIGKEPLGVLVTGSLLTFICNIDVLVLSFLEGDRVTGIYSAPTRLVMNAFVISEVLIISLYPYIVESFRKSKLDSLGQAMTSLMLIVFMPGIAACMLYPYEILSLLFGLEYAPGSSALALYSVTIVLYFLMVLYGNLYVISKNVRTLVKIYMVSAALTLILNVLLISRYSFLGASVATVIGQVSFLAIASIHFNLHVKRLNFGISSILLRSAIVISVLAGLHHLMKGSHLFVQLAVLTAAYAALIFAMRIIKISQIREVLSYAKRAD
jgi:O-antigen/teichoic acid export membrane protein